MPRSTNDGRVTVTSRSDLIKAAAARGAADPEFEGTAEATIKEIDAANKAKADGYDELTKAELVEHIDLLNKDRGQDDQLATTGNKPDLVARLREADAAKAAEDNSTP